MEDPINKCSKYDSILTTSIYFTHGARLGTSFFDVPCTDLAKNLLGTILVRRLSNGKVLRGRIVETECYLGYNDEASHSYNGKRTSRNESMFMDPGTLYVYQTYGMYFCVNISSQDEGSAVLIRAVEPITGVSEIIKNRQNHYCRRNRSTTCLESQKTFKNHELCNGPGKLCIGFGINIESCNKQNLITFNDMWLEQRASSDQIKDGNITSSTRIGIKSAGPESANKLLRFYLSGNQHVSVRDKKREQQTSISGNNPS